MKTAARQLFRNEAVVATDIQNELLIFDPVSKTAHVLNSTAKLIWNGVSTFMDAAIIADTLKAHSGTPVSTIENEVEEFIEKLDESGLLVTGEGTVFAAFNIDLPVNYVYARPNIDTYSEEFLREHLKDVSFATFHDDTYSDLSQG